MCGTYREWWVVWRTGHLWEMLSTYRKLSQQRETGASISGLEETQKIWQTGARQEAHPPCWIFRGLLPCSWSFYVLGQRGFHQTLCGLWAMNITFSSPSKERTALTLLLFNTSRGQHSIKCMFIVGTPMWEQLGMFFTTNFSWPGLLIERMAQNREREDTQPVEEITNFHVSVNSLPGYTQCHYIMRKIFCCVYPALLEQLKT